MDDYKTSETHDKIKQESEIMRRGMAIMGVLTDLDAIRVGEQRPT